jgi:hypothetical protein
MERFFQKRRSPQRERGSCRPSLTLRASRENRAQSENLSASPSLISSEAEEAAAAALWAVCLSVFRPSWWARPGAVQNLRRTSCYSRRKRPGPAQQRERLGKKSAWSPLSRDRIAEERERGSRRRQPRSFLWIIDPEDPIASACRRSCRRQPGTCTSGWCTTASARPTS